VFLYEEVEGWRNFVVDEYCFLNLPPPWTTWQSMAPAIDAKSSEFEEVAPRKCRAPRSGDFFGLGGLSSGKLNV